METYDKARNMTEHEFEQLHLTQFRAIIRKIRREAIRDTRDACAEAVIKAPSMVMPGNIYRADAQDACLNVKII